MFPLDQLQKRKEIAKKQQEYCRRKKHLNNLNNINEISTTQTIKQITANLDNSLLTHDNISITHINKEHIRMTKKMSGNIRSLSARDMRILSLVGRHTH